MTACHLFAGNLELLLYNVANFDLGNELVKKGLTEEEKKTKKNNNNNNNNNNKKTNKKKKKKKEQHKQTN